MAIEISLDEIIEDLQAIEPKILQYEKKYKLLSPYFHKLYKAGNPKRAGIFRIGPDSMRSSSIA